MQNYCLICKNNTDNIGSKKVIMTVTNKKVIRDKSRCADCWSSKSTFFKTQ